MNTVKMLEPQQDLNYNLSDLCPAQGSQVKETAFVGSIVQYKKKLFLISYSTIVLAENPTISWNFGGACFTVHRFVDVEITVKDKS